MKCFIHIGLHKTGSTSIQTNCAHFRGQLKAQGIVYPEIHTMWNSHAPLAWVMGVSHPADTGCLSFDDILSEYLVEAQGHSLLLSSEDFEFCDTDSVARLMSRLAAEFESLEVICYLRNPISYMESDYKWHIDDPDSPHKKKSAREFISEVNLAGRLDYHGILQRWAGERNVRINARCFCKSTLIGGDVVSDFFHQIGFAAFPLGSKENVSLTNLGAKICQILNNTHDVDRALRRKIDCEIRGITNRDAPLFDKEAIEAIEASCAESLRRLFQDFSVWGGKYFLMCARDTIHMTAEEEFAVGLQALCSAMGDPGLGQCKKSSQKSAPAHDTQQPEARPPSVGTPSSTQPKDTCD